MLVVVVYMVDGPIVDSRFYTENKKKKHTKNTSK